MQRAPKQVINYKVAQKIGTLFDRIISSSNINQFSIFFTYTIGKIFK